MKYTSGLRLSRRGEDYVSPVVGKPARFRTVRRFLARAGSFQSRLDRLRRNTSIRATIWQIETVFPKKDFIFVEKKVVDPWGPQQDELESQGILSPSRRHNPKNHHWRRHTQGREAYRSCELRNLSMHLPDTIVHNKPRMCEPTQSCMSQKPFANLTISLDIPWLGPRRRSFHTGEALEQIFFQQA
jgi:hypothetical protein